MKDRHIAQGNGVKQIWPEVASLQRYREELEETWQNSLNSSGPEGSDRSLEVNTFTACFWGFAKGRVFSEEIYYVYVSVAAAEMQLLSVNQRLLLKWKIKK